MKILLTTLAILTSIASAQAPQQKIALKLQPLETIVAKMGQPVTVTLTATVDPGFHVNSDKPADPYLIPLKLTWTEGVLDKPSISYPKPETAKLPFSEKPVTIFSNEFKITTQFKVAANAKPGSVTLTGKLRFQACNDHECLIPRTLDVAALVEIGK